MDEMKKKQILKRNLCRKSSEPGWLIDASEEHSTCELNIQTSFKRIPNGKKNKMDLWSFWEESWDFALEHSLSILATMDANSRTISFCLLARCFVSSCGELMHSSYRTVYSANVANPYTVDPPQDEELHSSLLCLAWRADWVNASYLWTTRTLSLNFSVPNTVSYRTKTGHTRKKDLILTRSGSTIDDQRVKVIAIEWRRDGEHKSDYLDNTLIVWTKCSANNFLDVVNEKMWRETKMWCSMNEKRSYWGKWIIIRDDLN